jgi:hypothetical protein
MVGRIRLTCYCAATTTRRHWAASQRPTRRSLPTGVAAGPASTSLRQAIRRLLVAPCSGEPATFSRVLQVPSGVLSAQVMQSTRRHGPLVMRSSPQDRRAINPGNERSHGQSRTSGPAGRVTPSPDLHARRPVAGDLVVFQRAPPVVVDGNAALLVVADSIAAQTGVGAIVYGYACQALATDVAALQVQPSLGDNHAKPRPLTAHLAQRQEAPVRDLAGFTEALEDAAD